MIVAWDDPAVEILGALDIRRTPSGIAPNRLPAWAEAQSPDAALTLMAAMPSGVRLRFATDARRVRLTVLETGLRLAPDPREPAAFDLYVDGDLAARAFATSGPTLVVDGSTTPFTLTREAGRASEILFEGFEPGDKVLEIWLPQSATVELRALEVDGRVWRSPTPPRRRWAHYGSSISHGMDAAGPSETWPAVAARAAGVELTSLGFAGQCHLDGLVARALRDAPLDLISLKLGINVINADSMRERAFIAAAHSFLDTIRDAKPETPILVISPILCPAAEDHPGPTRRTGETFEVVARGEDLQPGALTLRRVRRLLSSIVERRRAAGDLRLYYMDGLDLFAEADLADLPDGLHPNADGLRRMGERFAARAFGQGGAFGG